MKALLCFYIYLLASVSAIDYSTAFSDASCSNAATNTNIGNGRYQSPLDMTGSRCVAYEDFSITLTDLASSTFSFDQTTGAVSFAYTGASMTVNSVTYTSTEARLRYKSENIIVAETASDIEIQLLMSGGGADPVFLSFLLKGYATGATGIPIQTIITGTTPTLAINFATISTMINEKINQGLFLNLLTYQGTLTYPNPTCAHATWFVYGTEIPVDSTVVSDFSAWVAANAGASTLRSGTFNSRSTTDGSGAVTVSRLCFTGYFKNYMNENYGLWFGVVIIVFWFIINLMMGDKPIKDSEYQENIWTHHPFVSVYTYGNEIFTRKQRTAITLVTITIHALFSSVWYRQASDKTKGSNIIVFAIYSMLVDWAVTLFIGCLLRGYTIAKNQYYKTKEDAWDQKAQNRLFAFYFSLFVIIAVGWPFTVWNMGELHPEIDVKASNYWVASFFIGLALEFLLVDPIVCLLASKIGIFRTYAKYKGYFYDNLSHDTYLTYLKWD